MANLTNGLRREWNCAGDAWRADTLGQLQQRQGAQNNSHLLYAAAQQALEFPLVVSGDLDAQSWTSHTLSMRQNNSA